MEVAITARDRQARIAVSGAYAVQGLCFAGVLTQVPAIQKRFGFSDVHLSLILLAVPVVAGVGSVLAGILAPKVSSAMILRISGLGVCATAAAIGFSHTEVLLYASVAVFGLFVGAVDATMNIQGVAVQTRYGRSILASFHGWWSFAGIIGTLANSGTAHLHYSIDVSLLIIAAIGVMMVVLLEPRLLRPAEEPGPATPAIAATLGPEEPALVLPTAATAPGASAAPGATPKIKWGAVWLVGLAVMLMYIGESSTSNWAGVLLQNSLDASRTLIPLGLGAYLTFQLLGRTVADRVIRRIGAATTVAIGATIGAIGFGMVVAARQPWLAIAGFGVVGIGLCVVVPLAFSAAGALDPTGSGVVISRVNLFNYVGFVVGSALIGPISDQTGLGWAFLVPAVLCLGIVALSPAFRVVDSASTVDSRAIAA